MVSYNAYTHTHTSSISSGNVYPFLRNNTDQHKLSKSGSPPTSLRIAPDVSECPKVTWLRPFGSRPSALF